MELDWIKSLRENPKHSRLGDDAAVWAVDPKSAMDDCVLTVDMLTEGVDFLLAETEPERIGRKALAVNLSDVAAMGAIPTAALVAVALPNRTQHGLNSLELAERLYAGMSPLLDKYDVELIGGDTNCWDGGLVLSITAFGQITSSGPLRRGGGRSGDVLLVTGPLGGSLLEHQFDFEPRIFEALYLNENFEIHAAIDISDGLAIDLHRLAEESRLGAVLKSEMIPIAPDAVRMSKSSDTPPLEHALSDGEDFELLLAVEANDAAKLLQTQPLFERFGTTLYQIGFLCNGPGVWIQDDERLYPLPPKGFLHGNPARLIQKNSSKST